MTESFATTVDEHKDLRIRTAYRPETDDWVAHFDLPPLPGGFQTVVHTSMRRSSGPAKETGPTASAAHAAAVEAIDEYLR